MSDIENKEQMKILKNKVERLEKEVEELKIVIKTLLEKYCEIVELHNKAIKRKKKHYSKGGKIK